MHEDFKEQLRKTLGSVSEALEVILDGATSLIEMQRWRDPEKEAPPQNMLVLCWTEDSRWLIGCRLTRTLWSYEENSLEKERRPSAPFAWMPLPHPPKEKPT